LIKTKKSIKNMEEKEKENLSKENMNMSAWKNISWTKGQIWSMIKKNFSSPLPLHLTHEIGSSSVDKNSSSKFKSLE
jgi:hypothetical protein